MALVHRGLHGTDRGVGARHRAAAGALPPAAGAAVLPAARGHVGGCQNDGPFVGPLHNTAPSI